jgi:N-acetylglucosaminyldiphosphoundecaprenol N-acetyl-beta-D-mannosaminyltransferase
MISAHPNGNAATDRIDVMGLGLNPISERGAIATALSGLAAGHGGWICPANLDVLRQVTAAPELRSMLDGADLIVADGMPLLWASRLQGEPLPERVAGSSLITTLPTAAAAEGRRVFLLGGNPGAADAAAEVLRAATPGLQICGTLCPPHGFEQDATQLARIEASLRADGPDIVFVALGFPKQERLIVRLRRVLPAAWFVSVGISFSFVSGEVARAPAWMQRAGLEWVHRLGHEPRRLAHRYLVAGIPFLVRVLVRSARRRHATVTEVPS